MLGECHAHIIMNGENYKNAIALHRNAVDDEVIHQCFAKYRHAKIRFIRDGGDCYGVSKRAKDLAGEYGIDYRTPIYAIHKKGHYGSIVGRSFDNIKEYELLVNEVKQAGGDFIKIIISGLIDFSGYGLLSEAGLHENEIREMIHIAHEEGMAVMAHCNGARAMEAAATAGADSIEHGAYADENALQVMAEREVIWTPTVSPIGNLKGTGRFADHVTEKIKEEHLNRICRYVQLGGRIALGSDAGAFMVPHVEGIRTELDFLKACVEKQHLMETQRLMEERFRRK